MDAASLAIVGLYGAALAGLAAFGAHRLFLALLTLRRRAAPPHAPAGGPLPAVTVQLPVYNEIYVLDRLVEAVCALRHPRHLLQIQILDDSTDGTSERAREIALRWRERGHDVECLHRGRREGFKAGALAAGMREARGAFIAVFDADFVPPPDFLERTLPCFADPAVGMVQARWGHLNRRASLLTRAQALMLDAHFSVDQAARSLSGRFLNFNGTAGIFRRRCIEEAGGWEADTLTEDLDLSYRAQLAGWRFVYVDDLVCPAELPVEIDALRSQQHRWTKGSIETARKILPRVWRSAAPLRVKVEATFHLTNNAAYLLLFAASILLVPSLAVRREMGWSAALPDLLVLGAGTGSFALSCLLSRRNRPSGWLTALAEIPAVMALGAGLALNNALAVLEGLAGRRSEFRRTPKYRIVDGARRRGPSGAEAGAQPALGEGAGAASPQGERGLLPWEGAAYRGDPTRLPLVEGGLSLVFCAAAAWAAISGPAGAIPFLALFAAGYGGVAWCSLAQALASRRVRARRALGAAAA